MTARNLVTWQLLGKETFFDLTGGWLPADATVIAWILSNSWILDGIKDLVNGFVKDTFDSSLPSFEPTDCLVEAPTIDLDEIVKNLLP